MSDRFDFTVVLEPQPEGGFTVSVPALPEVVTEGDSEAEAMAMAEDAIRPVLTYRRDHGIPIPGAAQPTYGKSPSPHEPLLACRKCTAGSCCLATCRLCRTGYQAVIMYLVHPDDTRRTATIPFHGSRSLKAGTLRNITRQAGLTVDEFRGHL